MSARADQRVSSLVRGVLWPGFAGIRPPTWLQHELDGGLAGVVVFGHNVSGDEESTAALSRALREHRENIAIGIDEEGGSVSRLEAATGSTLPGHAQLGRLDDVDTTRAVGTEIARRLRAVGMNVALTPVADVNTNARNPIIGVRSFAADADQVSRHVIAMVDGLQSAGVAACVKHYPGHGDTTQDSHLSLPRLDLSLAELERDHLPPFSAAIAAGARAVMTAHVVVPELGDRPATLNPRAIELLRNAGFEGTVVSDALDMAAIQATVGAGAGAVRALLAGVDLLCIGNPTNLGPKGGRTSDEQDYREVFDAVCAAVDDGTLPIATLERSAGRVRALTEGLPQPELPAMEFSGVIRDVVTVRGALPHPASAVTVLDVRDRPSIAVASRLDPFSAAFADALPTERVALGGAPEHDELDATVTMIDTERTVLVLADRLAFESDQFDAVARIATLRPDAVVVNSGIASVPDVPLSVVDCLGSSRLAATRVLELVSAVSGGASAVHPSTSGQTSSSAPNERVS